jgi:hypothetical protein
MKIISQLLLLSALLGAALTLSAQTIYRCQLADGSYVYQQNTCSDDQVRGDTISHKVWREMRALSSEGINILTGLGASVESIKTCERRMKGFAAKVKRVGKDLEQVPPNQKLLFKSYGYLEDCAVCRTSAISSCQIANSFLDKAMADLMEY